MKKYNFLLLTTLFILIFGCKSDLAPEIKPQAINPEPAILWAQLTLKTVTKLPKNTPTYCSRALGYLGLTMYECVVNGSEVHQSMANQLAGEPLVLPKPEIGKKYVWALALNAGQAFMLKHLYKYAPIDRLNEIDSLENLIFNKYSQNIPDEVVNRSIAFGKRIAEQIFERSKTDGGYEAYDKNFDFTFKFPTDEGKWRPAPSGGGQGIPGAGGGVFISPYPLHHFWGQNKTFSKANYTLPVPDYLTYSNDYKSEYYKQYRAVYNKNLVLTKAERMTAAWWADDPSETFSPPGHSYSLANIIVKASNADLFKAAETYARVGMAVADAFVNCWKTKYTYFSERPAWFVFRNIPSSFQSFFLGNAPWVQYWPEPPFPAFYSGHASQGAACATVLENIYGKNFTIIDNSHTGRPWNINQKVGYNTRRFSSFWAVAVESAYSRFLGGIHIEFDNRIGLQEGRKVGENINALIWKK